MISTCTFNTQTRRDDFANIVKELWYAIISQNSNVETRTVKSTIKQGWWVDYIENETETIKYYEISIEKEDFDINLIKDLSNYIMIRSIEKISTLKAVFGWIVLSLILLTVVAIYSYKIRTFLDAYATPTLFILFSVVSISITIICYKINKKELENYHNKRKKQKENLDKHIWTQGKEIIKKYNISN